MKVVPSQNLGDLGPGDGEPVLVDWRWYHFLPGLSYWVFMAILLILWKTNRQTVTRVMLDLFLLGMVAYLFL